MVRVAAIVLALSALAAAPCAQAVESEIAVITHPSRKVSLDVAQVRRIYLKQRRFWPDGDPIVAINLESGPLRDALDRKVFGEASQLATYWNRRYFEGVFPPITLASEEAVRRYVASKPNAIGYVTTRTVDDSVHVALLLPGNAPTSPSASP